MMLPHLNDVIIGLRDRFRGQTPSGDTERPRSTRTGPEDEMGSRGKNPSGFLLKRYYNSLLVYLPDNKVGWLPPAVWKGVALHLNPDTRFDAIYTTGPPQSTHLIGLLLKMLLGTPWISDFRDPWDPTMKPIRSRTRISEILEGRMERAVIRKSDWVISVTPEMTDRLCQLYTREKEKCVTVYNGFDEPALRKYRGQEPEEPLTMTYVGSLYFGRNPTNLLRAVRELVDEGVIDPGSFRIRFIGDCRSSDGISVEDLVSDMVLSDIVSFTDRVSQAEALQAIAKSHVALLMAPDQPLQIPGKVYEYLGMKKTVLAICGEGATRNLLNQYPWAFVASPDSLPEIKDCISRLVSRERSIEDERSGIFPWETFERATTVRQVAALLDLKVPRHGVPS